MREIEFRGKRNDNDEWIYGSLLIDEIQNSYVIVDNQEGIGREVIPETIGQYTGLKDKNEKKIFEGDIIKFIYESKEKIRAIVFEKGEFLAKDDTTAFGSTFRHIRLCSNIEVIGNIYDNPELLKEEL